MASSCSAPGGAAGGVALDAPARRVGGGGADARQLEGARVDPGAVPVAVVEIDGAVGHERVELGGRRAAGREVVHRPAAAVDPLALGVVRGIGRDDAAVLLAVVRVVEPAAVAREAAALRVHVRVLEAGQQAAALQVDDVRGRADVGLDVGVEADGGDPPAVDRDSRDLAPGGVRRVDGAVAEDEVGGHAGRC